LGDSIPMMQEEPFVSVLTPFYNTAQYLPECIESVLNQDYRHFEYVLLDNRSTDESALVAETFARRDSRIRFVRADRFRSQIDNYNHAIQYVSPASRYVKFAQADDRLYRHNLRQLVRIAESDPSVGLVSSYDLRGNDVYGHGLPPDRQIFSGRETARAYLLNWIFPFGSPTTVLYRADVVRARTPFFPDDALHSDTEAVFRILAEHAFGFAHEVLSFTRVREESISAHRQALADGALDRLIVVKRFGRHYLDDAEYDKCVLETEDLYYRTLGRRSIMQLVGTPSREFWKFHREGLTGIGEEIKWGRVAGAVFRILTDNILNPRQASRARQAYAARR
jgi:glycosyltransferase involved in cell wall biosynthesis